MADGMNEVLEHLDRAVEASEEAGISTSSLIGTLFYYAHNLAQQTRESGLEAREKGSSSLPEEPSD